MADVSPVSDGGPPDDRLTPDIQRLLDLLAETAPHEADGLTVEEWAIKSGKGRDSMRRAISALVRANQMSVGYQVRPNILGRMVRIPVYAVKK